MTLKHVTLLPDRVGNWQEYPFSVPAIATLREITIHKPIVFFVGENGSGKSTLLEAIAIHYGFGREGGSRNLRTETTESVRSVEPLVSALRVGFSKRTGAGFYLRAERLLQYRHRHRCARCGGRIRRPQSTRAIPRRVLHFTGGKQVQQRRLLRDGRTRSGVVSATAIELIGDTA
jgi:predicted ATPase